MGLLPSTIMTVNRASFNGGLFYRLLFFLNRISAALATSGGKLGYLEPQTFDVMLIMLLVLPALI